MATFMQGKISTCCFTGFKLETKKETKKAWLFLCNILYDQYQNVHSNAPVGRLSALTPLSTCLEKNTKTEKKSHMANLPSTDHLFAAKCSN